MQFLHSVFRTNFWDRTLHPTPVQQVPQAGECQPLCSAVGSEASAYTHQSQPQPSVVGAVLRPPLRKSTPGSFLFSSMSPGSVCFLSGLLWVTVGGTNWVSAQKSKEAMLNQIDGLCDFPVSLPGTQLANCLCAFNHVSFHISPLGLGCIALKQNGIYSGLCH